MVAQAWARQASSAASQTGVYVIYSGHTRPCLISMIPRDADRWLRSYPGIDPASFTSRIHICLRIHGTREASYTGSDQERKGMDKREGGVWVLPWPAASLEQSMVARLPPHSLSNRTLCLPAVKVLRWDPGGMSFCTM
jgi:hypothetical protein